MKFSTREDIDAPIDAVFEMLSDFEGFERAAMRRGAEVQRTDDLRTPGTGMTWAAVFDLRGKRREMEVEMAVYDRPSQIVVESTSPGLIGQMSFDLVALSRSRTRVLVELEVKPLNLSARLMVQSMKLARGTLVRKYKSRISEFAKVMEERHKRAV